jgi:lysozyme family protein
MASLLGKLYNKGKEAYNKYVPQEVKKVINPIVKPVVEAVKPAVKKTDQNIDKKIQTVKQAVKENTKKREELNKIKKDQKNKKEEARKAEEEKVRQELIAKQKTVDDKAKEEGDRINELATKTAKATTEQIDRAVQLAEGLVTNPLETVQKIGKEVKDYVKIQKDTIKLGYQQNKSKIAMYNAEAQRKKVRALEIYNQDPNAFNPYDPYGNSFLKQQQYKNSDIEEEQEKFFDMQEIFNINRDLTIQKLNTMNEFATNYSQNKTPLERMGFEVSRAFFQNIGNYPEFVKNQGINILAGYVTVQTGNPYIGKAVDWILSGSDAAYTYVEEVRMYEGREPTAREMAINAMGGIVLSEGLGLAGKGVKLGVGKTLDIASKTTGMDINYAGNYIKAIPAKVGNYFWDKIPQYGASSQFSFEGVDFNKYTYTASDMKTGIDGDFEQKRFYSKVKNKEINQNNYDPKLDPSFKLENNEFRDDSYLNSMGNNTQNINPNSGIFSKLISSIDDDLEVTNKSGTKYVGTQRIKQHLSQTRSEELKTTMIKAIEPTVRALQEDRAKANSNDLIFKAKSIIMGKDKAAEHFFTDVNQNNTFEKIGNMIQGRYIGNQRRLRADFFNHLSEIYGNRIIDARDLVREFKSDPGLFTRLYLEAEYDYTTDVNLNTVISGVIDDSQTMIKLNKGWNDSVDVATMKNYPNLFTNDGVNPKEAFKLFLKNFDGVEKSDLKQIKTIYDFSEVAYDIDNLFGRASRKMGITVDWTTKDMVKQLETAYKKTGRELFYDIESDSFLWLNSKEENKLFSLGRNKKNPDYLKVSELIDKYMKAPTEDYTNNSFKYLTPDNFKMGRVEAVFSKQKYLRDYNNNFNHKGEMKKPDYFRDEIFPKMQDTFNLKEDVTLEQAALIYKDVHAIISETTRAKHLRGLTTELGEVLPYFKDYESFVKFLSDMDYLHDNEMFVDNVILRTLDQQAEYLTFGKPARAFINDTNFNLTKNVDLNNEVQLDGLYIKSIEAMKNKVNTAIENKIIKSNPAVVESNPAQNVLKGTLSLMNTYYLGWSGTGENLQNRAYSNFRAKEYLSTRGAKLTTDLATVAYFPVDFLRGSGMVLDILANGANNIAAMEDVARALKKATSVVMGENKVLKMSDGDTSLLYSAFNNEFNRIKHFDSVESFYSNAKDFILSPQQTSEMMRNAIDVFNSNKSLYDTINLKYDEVSPSLKKLFLVNGIDEKDFEAMKPILRDFKKNNELIQPQRLLELEIEGFSEASNVLRLYDDLFYELNTLNKKNAYVKSDGLRTLQDSGAKFARSTTQGMALDTFQKMMFFEDTNGVSRFRFGSLEGVKVSAAKTVEALPALITLSVTGKIGQLQKMMIAGRYDALQYLAVELAEESERMEEIINSKNPAELVLNIAGYGADNIIEYLKENWDYFGNNNLVSMGYQAIGEPIYKLFTGKGEKDKITAAKDTLIGVGRIVTASVFGQKTLSIYDKAERGVKSYQHYQEFGTPLPYDTALIDRIKNEDTRSRAGRIYDASQGAVENYNGIKIIRGSYEAFVTTGQFLKPNSESMFKKVWDDFWKDEEKSAAVIQEVAEYIDTERKTQYENVVEEYQKNLLAKLFLGEITEEEYDRLSKQAFKDANMVNDAYFTMMNKEIVNIFNDVSEFRGLTPEQKLKFKEDLMNKTYEVMGRNTKLDSESIKKILLEFIPENEIENFTRYTRERKADKKVNAEDSFNYSLDFIFDAEGGYSNDVGAGGHTKYGITEETAKRHGLNVFNITREQAEAIYKKDYWDKNQLGRIKDKDIALTILDLSINGGNSAGAINAQRAINNLYGKKVVSENGKIDNKTIELINNSDPSSFLNEYSKLQKQHYVEVVKKNPNKKKYYQGWINRINNKVDYISEGGIQNNGTGLNQRSQNSLNDVDTRLADLAADVAQRHDITITQGFRTKEEQARNVQKGVSWTMDGYHLEGKAFDFYVNSVLENNRIHNPTKEDKQKAEAFARDMIEEGKKRGLNIGWGGDWKQRDTPHIELKN